MSSLFSELRIWAKRGQTHINQEDSCRWLLQDSQLQQREFLLHAILVVLDVRIAMFQRHRGTQSTTLN
jgi:hypothetical protein